MKLDIVDVFAESKYAGNQLAVVHDAATLSTEQMQDIAREMNFSETTFVTRATPREADVRIFTPAGELPFAGHPTLGTAWVLSGGQGEYRLNLGAGPVEVAFVDGVGWISPPPVTLGEVWHPQLAAALLSLDIAELDADFPLQFAAVGPQFILVGVRSLDSLKRVAVDPQLYQTHVDAGLPMRSIFVFTQDGYVADANFAARMFFHTGTIREDPATGSANAAFAAYLRAHRGNLGSIIVDQGVEMDRPSRLYLQVADSLLVGGKVVLSVQGELMG